MSCEGSQRAFWQHSASRPEVAAAFGGAAQAAQALDEVFAIARAQAERAADPPDRLTTLRAEAATRALFGEMRERYNLKPPAHAVNGLPKPDAQHGYLAVYQTLQAIATTGELPKLAQQVRAAMQLSPAGVLQRAALTPTLEQAKPVVSYDREGYDLNGYSREGFDREGFNRQGRDRAGFDRNGFDTKGYNRHGYTHQGYNRDGRNAAGYIGGNVDPDGYTMYGYQNRSLDGRRDQFDREGYDGSGYDAKGYDHNGYTRSGYDRRGLAHPFFRADAQGLYGDGLDAYGCGADGYGPDGRDRAGFDRDGYNKYNRDRNGFNRDGVNESGLDAEGYTVAGYKRDPSTYGDRDRLGYDTKGLDATGFTSTGYDRKGYDRQGNTRTLTVSPKTGKMVEAKYNRTGWDQFGYDRTGFHRSTGLTVPDAHGQRRNHWGWVFDEATQQVVNPADPTQRAAHVGVRWDRYAERTVPNRGYRPLLTPPITPHAPMTEAQFLATLPTQQRTYEQRVAFKQRQQSTVQTRWETKRALYDPKAAKAGALIRCPQCGQFTGGTAHACPAFRGVSSQVIPYVSGMVWSTGNPYGVVQTPLNENYDPTYDTLGGYDTSGFDRQGYNHQGYNQRGYDREGYTREGYDMRGYDRAGFDRRGYNEHNRDRDGNVRPRTVEDAAKGLEEGSDPINNEHLASLYSRIASSLRGQKRTVVFREGEGFATDMKGTIYADPYPLGRSAPDAHNLVVVKGGVYHELGHEQFTPPAIWAAILDIARSPIEVEGLNDQGRQMLPGIYNIVEDGGIERRLSAQYAGVGEVLAASCALDPRWDEHVGAGVPVGHQVQGALLYAALPYYTVSDEVRAKMTPEARALFEELEPVVHAAVRGSPDDRYRAAVHVTRRLQEEGVLQGSPPDLKTTPPPPPPAGTTPRQPQSGQQGGQQQSGQSSQHGDQDGAQQNDQNGQQDGQHDQQQGSAGRQQGGQEDDQGSQQSGGGSGGQQGDQDGQEGQQGDGGGSGHQGSQQQGSGSSGSGRQQGGQYDDQGSGGGRGSGAASDDPQNGRGVGRGTASDDEPKGPGRKPAAPDEPQGSRRAPAASDEPPGPGRQSAAPQQPQESGVRSDTSDQDGKADPGTRDAPGGTSGAGGSVGSDTLRDVSNTFSDADIASVIATTEREAAAAIDAGVRQGSRIEGLGAALHRPLGDADDATQRYRSPEGRVETVLVQLPRTSDAKHLDTLAKRRPAHQKVASDLARQLKAVRDDTERVVRFQREGQFDRRRMIPAVKGAADVRKQRQPLPETRFAASISVDLSGSMAGHVGSGALYDATMVLGDTFDHLDIPYEVRGIGTGAQAFKSMDDQHFGTERAAVLASETFGGTNMAPSSGLASTALRAREENNKLLIALTDGAAGDHAATCKILAEARRQGVVTFGMYLGSRPPTEQLDELYGPGNWVQLNDLKDMPVAVGRRLVATFKRLQSKRSG